MRTRQVLCNYCGRPAVLDHHPSGPRYGRVWICRPCEAWVGCHENSPSHAPLGRLANAELRKLKMQAHAAFDPLWTEGHMSRGSAYRILRRALQLRKPFHIGDCTPLQCRRVIEVATRKLVELRRRR